MSKESFFTLKMKGGIGYERKETFSEKKGQRFLLMPLFMVIAGAIILWGGVTPALSENIPDEIRIGDTVSFTGPYAIFGGLSSFGTKAAIEDINKQGGVYVKNIGKKLADQVD